MSTIHFIEREGRFERVPKSPDEWESGYWKLNAETAANLVGGDVYFHSAKSERSHFGGTVLGSRVQTGGEFEGKTVLRFRYTKHHRGVSGNGGKWGVERKPAAKAQAVSAPAADEPAPTS
jgi:hypothetical protein